MNKTHIATFMGTIKKKRYEYGNERDLLSWSSYTPKMILEYFEEGYEVIQSDSFYNPPMSQGDKVNLETIDKNVTVKDVVRDSDGGYIYYTDHVIEEIEDEETFKTLNKAREEDMDNKLEELQRDNKKLEEKLKEKTKKSLEATKQLIEFQTKKWYQFWK